MRELALICVTGAMVAGLFGCGGRTSAGDYDVGGAAPDGGSGGAGATGGTGATGGSTASGGSDPDVTTLKAQYGPTTIQSGEESVQCVVVALNNPEPVRVRRFRTKLADGSHHMIVYTTTEAPTSTPFPCQSFAVEGGSAIFIAQQPESELTLPIDASGLPVALDLTANQLLKLEVHYINATGAPLDVSGLIELDVLPVGVNALPSSFLFQGAFDVPEIPPFGEADTGVRFDQGIPGTKVFALTTHQHQLGTRMRVWHADNVNDLSTPIADSTSWHDPPLELFDPPLDFPLDGSKGFAYQCHWENPTSQSVHGGLGANDEMCFFWSYYYPSPQ